MASTRGAKAAAAAAAAASSSSSVGQVEALSTLLSAVREDQASQAATLASLVSSLSAVSARLAALPIETKYDGSPSARKRPRPDSPSGASLESAGAHSAQFDRIGADSAESGLIRPNPGSPHGSSTAAAAAAGGSSGDSAGDDDREDGDRQHDAAPVAPAVLPAGAEEPESIAMDDELWPYIVPSFFGPPRVFTDPALSVKAVRPVKRSELAASWPDTCTPLRRLDRDRLVKAGAPTGASSDPRWTEKPGLDASLVEMLRGKSADSNSPDGKNRRCTLADTLARTVIPSHATHLLEVQEYLCGIFSASEDIVTRGYLLDAIRLLADSGTSLVRAWTDAVFTASQLAVHKDPKKAERYKTTNMLDAHAPDLIREAKDKKALAAALTAASTVVVKPAAAAAAFRGGKAAAASRGGKAPRHGGRGRPDPSFTATLYGAAGRGRGFGRGRGRGGRGNSFRGRGAVAGGKGADAADSS